MCNCNPSWGHRPGYGNGSDEYAAIRQARWKTGVQAGLQWDEARANGQAAQHTIQYGNPADRIRPLRNTEGFLGYFAAQDGDITTINPSEFRQAFGLRLPTPQLASLMSTLDRVDGQRNFDFYQNPAISMQDALPLVAFYDSAGFQQPVDMRISPQERQGAFQQLDGYMSAGQPGRAELIQRLQDTGRRLFSQE